MFLLTRHDVHLCAKMLRTLLINVVTKIMVVKSLLHHDADITLHLWLSWSSLWDKDSFSEVLDMLTAFYVGKRNFSNYGCAVCKPSQNIACLVQIQKPTFQNPFTRFSFVGFDPGKGPVTLLCHAYTAYDTISCNLRRVTQFCLASTT